MALVLCIGLLPASARAASTPPDFSDGWTALTSEHGGQTLNGGNYYLADDVTITKTIAITGTVTLDLNGKTLSYSGSLSTGSNSVIQVSRAETSPTLQDSGTGGCI